MTLSELIAQVESESIDSDTRTHADGYEDHGPIVYASPPARIGKHEWRIVVYTHNTYGRCTDFQFRGPNAPHYRPSWPWNTSKLWPGYNGNDYHSGLPRSLDRLFGEYANQVRNALGPRK